MIAIVSDHGGYKLKDGGTYDSNRKWPWWL